MGGGGGGERERREESILKCSLVKASTMQQLIAIMCPPFIQVACQRLLAHIGETQSHLLSDNLVVVSSDFKRALETATIIHEHFKVKAPLRLERNLRERDFGQLNLTNASNYHKVWRHDALNPTHTEFGCETVMSVLSRTTMLLEKLKKEFQFEEKIVLLVSHGDTLQITLTAYAGVAPEYHRTLSSLGNCDVRELVEPDS